MDDSVELNFDTAKLFVFLTSSIRYEDAAPLQTFSHLCMFS